MTEDVKENTVTGDCKHKRISYVWKDTALMQGKPTFKKYQ
jgi:hypothetical protein